MKKIKKLILAARDDGFGERMCCLLNAMYISKKTSLKFGFTWKNKTDSLVKSYTNQNNYLACNDQIDVQEIFSCNFIKKYHYDNFNVSPLDKFFLFFNKNIKELENKPYEYFWGWRSCQANLTTIFSDIEWVEYQKTLNQCWNEIEFSYTTQQTINKAYSKADLLNSYTAVHIRSGDLIFEFIGQARWIWFTANKAFSFHLALELILQEIQKNHIIIFTDDISSAKKIINYIDTINTSKYECLLAYELFKDNENNSNQRVIFEIVLMSRAKKIYLSGDSGFSRMASFIGQSKIINVYKLFDQTQQIYYISKNLLKLKLNRYQMSYSYFMLYLRSKEKSLPKYKQLFYLKKGYEQNPENYIFKLCELDIYLNNGEFKKADNYLKMIFNLSFDIYFDFLLKKSYDLKHYDNVDLFPGYLKYTGNKYKNINLTKYILASDLLKNIYIFGNSYNQSQILLIKVLEDQKFITNTNDYLKFLNKNYICVKTNRYDLLSLINYSIAIRFFNRLDYILGNRIVQTKNLKNLLTLRYDLHNLMQNYRYLIEEYKLRRKTDKTFKLNPLSTYYNYELINIYKKHLSYQIGRSLIISLKNNPKLYPLLLPLNILKIYIKFKLKVKK